MKFRTLLTEATFVKRSFQFLVEVELANKKKRMLFCPNLGVLKCCEVPGTKLWFRMANRLSQGYLDILELVEVNASIWVAINTDYAEALLREGIHKQLIPELEDFKFLNFNRGFTKKRGIELLLHESGPQCFIYITPVFWGNEHGEAFFPDSKSEDIRSIYELIKYKESGQRAVLFYSVQHTGIQCIRPNISLYPAYGEALKCAVQAGVEIIAYRANINLREITLETRIPVLLSQKNIISN